MRIRFLGTGTSQGVPIINCACQVCLSTNPKDNRLRSSILVQDENTNIIIDVGPDFRQQLLRFPISHLDAVLLTHEHNDHVAGMDDLRPFNFIQNADIPIYSLSRVQDEIKSRFYYAFQESIYPGAPGYELHESNHADILKIGSMNITCFEVMHGNLPILGYKIKNFVYITDAKTISSDSLQLIRNCDTLVINALRIEEHWSHLTLNEALKIIEEIKPRVAYLTHMSHLIGLHEEITMQLPENVFLSFDGLRIDC